MKPKYICIGVQKGGTCSLIKYLNLHPEIYMAKKVQGSKEFVKLIVILLHLMNNEQGDDI